VQRMHQKVPFTFRFREGTPWKDEV
jgi:hypothetical protein